MTERSLLWTNTGGDGGPYSQDQLRLLQKVLAGAGAVNEGVIGAQLNSLRPSSPGNNQVTIDTGRAMVDGTLYENDAALTINVTIPVVGTTGKRLVLRKSWSAKTVRAVVISSADGTASLPALTQTDLTTWEIPIASFQHATSGVISGKS